MWFDDSSSSKRKKNSKQKHVLSVNRRVSSKNAVGTYRMAVFVLVPTVLVIVSLLSWFGVKSAGGALFSENEMFSVRNLNIITQAGARISKDEIKEWTMISEGTNIFAFNIQDVRERILENAINIRSLEIRRHLPGTVEIKVTEREPIARLGRSGYFGVDNDGYVFIIKSAKILPVLEGYRKAGERVKPGDCLDGMSLAGLDVLEVCDNPSIGLNIRAIDVRASDHLVLYLSGGPPVDLSWEKMSERDPASRVFLIEKLRKVSLTANSSRGKKMRRINATYEDRVFGVM